VSDTYSDLEEQPDGTFRAVERTRPDPVFSITDTCTQDVYIPPDRKVKKTPGTMELILEKIREGASVAGACHAAGVTTATLRGWRKRDPEFDTACKSAWELGTAAYEEAAFSRGKDGTVADVYHQGLVVGQKIEHHDTLLLKTLERRAPEDWGRQQRVELTGQGGGPLRVQTLDLTRSIEELAAHGHSFLTEEYRALLEKPSGEK